MVICLGRGTDCLHMAQLMPLHPKTSSFLASFKSRLVLPFRYRLTQVVLEKRPLNGCSSSSSTSILQTSLQNVQNNFTNRKKFLLNGNINPNYTHIVPNLKHAVDCFLGARFPPDISPTAVKSQTFTVFGKSGHPVSPGIRRSRGGGDSCRTF